MSAFEAEGLQLADVDPVDLALSKRCHEDADLLAEADQGDLLFGCHGRASLDLSFCYCYINCTSTIAIVKRKFFNYDRRREKDELCRGGTVNLVQTSDVLDIWKVDGKRINIRTFNKLVEAFVAKGEMKVAYLKTGDRLFDEADAERLKKFLPKTQPPKYIGIVNAVLEAMKKKGRG